MRAQESQGKGQESEGLGFRACKPLHSGRRKTRQEKCYTLRMVLALLAGSLAHESGAGLSILTPR